jgi:hypothetical protein
MANPDQMAAVVQSAASRVVAELLGEQHGSRPLHRVGSDSEFADGLVDRELAMIADGEDPLRVSLRIAILRTSREALRTFAEIRALPEQPQARA